MTENISETPEPHHRKRLRNAARFTGLVFLALTGAAVLFFLFLPESWLRSIAGGKGSSAIGREFAIDGPLDIDWDWTTPAIHAEKIRLANMPGMDDANMLEIGRIDFRIKIWQLLYGKLNLPELTISDAKLALQKKDKDTVNWDFPALSKAQAVSAAAVPESRHDFPVIGKLVLKSSTLHYKDDIKKLDLSLTLDTASGSSDSKEDSIKVSGKGTLQDQAFTLEATGGSVSQLRNSEKPYPLDLQLSMGKTAIAVKGTFLDPVKLTGVDATLDIKGDNMADLFYLTSIPLPPTPPYSITGMLKKDAEVWNFNGFKGKVGDSDLGGDLQYTTVDERANVTADLKSNTLDMDDLSGFIGAPPSTKKGETVGAEQKEEARERAASARVLPDVPINLERLRAADMKVTLDAARLHAPGYPLDSLNVTVNLKDGVLTIDPMKLGVASGAVEGKIVLDGRGDVPDVTMDVVMKKLALKDFFKGSQFEDLSAGHFGGHVDLRGRGKSLADVLATSNGHLTLTMSGGKISLLLIEAAGLDIAEAGGLLLGEDKTTDIRCAVGDFAVKDGLLNSNILVFDTTDTNLQGKARINLKDETMDATMEAHPKDPSPLEIKTPVRVTGTLKHPDIGLDPKEAGARGGAAAILATLLTPLAAIIPFIELGTGEDSDCRDLIAQARAHADAGAPSP